MDYIQHLINSQSCENAPILQIGTEIKAYLGLLTYYSRFYPIRLQLYHHFTRLLHSNGKWQWTSSEAKAFQESKNLLTSMQYFACSF